MEVVEILVVSILGAHSYLAASHTHRIMAILGRPGLGWYPFLNISSDQVYSIGRKVGRLDRNGYVF